jgi:hypothetical protein
VDEITILGSHCARFTPVLQHFGFQVEPFGSDSYQVRAMPTLLKITIVSLNRICTARPGIPGQMAMIFFLPIKTTITTSNI